MSLKLMKHLKTFKNSEAGQSLVQLALILPILMLLLSFTVDLGRYFDKKLIVSNIASELSRTYDLNEDKSAIVDSVLNNYSDRIPKDKVTVTFGNKSTGDTYNYQVYTYRPNASSEGIFTLMRTKDVKVNVDYTFEFIMPISTLIFGDTIIIHQDYTFRAGLKDSELPK